MHLRCCSTRHLRIGLLAFSVSLPATRASDLIGRVVDAETGQPIPARVYVRDAAGQHWFVTTASPEGSAIPYREQWVPMPDSVEQHTTISAHPFRIDLPPGEYRLSVERGKEYLPLHRDVVVSDQPQQLELPLVRWVRMDERGWYSGETHVHRRLSELPNVMRAEQLNVAFPVTFWTTRSDAPPDLEPSTLRSQGPSPFGRREDAGYLPIRVDEDHVIFPRNTEYEIFSVDGQRHTLGAIFILNHRTPFQQTAPPIGPIAAAARAEGALLDLDKHSWPWSMMLVPIAQVDLFELSNNSVWRTQFGFRHVTAPLPPWAEFESDGPGMLTEWGWLNYGFEVYYALLNCGFRIAPTAGTASGVHPVPLGYSRVYVNCGQPLDADRWLEGLRRGNSFVTTGPMLLAEVAGKSAGETLRFPDQGPRRLKTRIESISPLPITSIEVLVNGEVVDAITPKSQPTEHGAWRVTLEREIEVSDSSWVAIRGFEVQPDGRRRFAHTAPWFVTMAERPIRPKREQVEYFVGLMEAEIRRNEPVLSAAALSEFQQALDFYRALLP